MLCLAFTGNGHLDNTDCKAYVCDTVRHTIDDRMNTFSRTLDLDSLIVYYSVKCD